MLRHKIDQVRMEQLLHTEKPLWNSGTFLIAGADEVGRGPLAGPVMAACIVMPAEPLIFGVYDSKKLAASKRQRLSEEICETATAVGFGAAESSEIDEVGIAEATKRAFYRSIEAVVRQLGQNPDHLFTDSVRLHLDFPVTSMVRADQQAYNVAAASIVAKVRRDAIMKEYAKQYPEYGFDTNSGYGTETHRCALIKYGPSPIHRQSFLRNLEVWKAKLGNSG